MSASYLPPLDQLLTLGEPEFGHRVEWLDYLGMGITAEHVPELIRMLTDLELVTRESDSPQVYAVVHAWRTLGLLRAESAVEPLLVLMEDEEDDWAHEDLPVVLGMIGQPAFDPLRAALSRWSLNVAPWAAASAARGLVETAQRTPEMRDAAVGALMGQLRWWSRQDPGLNSMLINDLADLDAVEAAPLMEEVFAAGAADIDFGEDWEDVQVRLGLLPERLTPRARFGPLRWRLRPAPVHRSGGARPDGAAKRRRKAAKASRRRNRKRR